MLIIFIRSTIIFVTLLVVMRLMGKRQIGEMQPFELVITLIVADLACIPMADVSIPLLYGIFAIIALFILHQLITLLDRNGGVFKKIVSGRPSIVIDSNGLDLDELLKNNMGVDELLESMRTSGYFSFDELEYGIYETNGIFSALPRKSVEQDKVLPVIIVARGKIDLQNLDNIFMSKAELLNILRKKHVFQINKVEVMTINSNGKVYLKVKKLKFEVFHLNEQSKKKHEVQSSNLDKKPTNKREVF